MPILPRAGTAKLRVNRSHAHTHIHTRARTHTITEPNKQVGAPNPAVLMLDSASAEQKDEAFLTTFYIHLNVPESIYLSTRQRPYM